MIESVSMHDFGMHEKIDWQNLAGINLLIGENSSGKTFLLKALYVALKTLELHRRGDDKQGIEDILADKLYWTFQVDRLGELVRRNVGGKLFFSMQAEGNRFSYGFGRDTNKKIIGIQNGFSGMRQQASAFIPAKEVLSLFSVILKSREQDQMFGFDDTYLDLVKALQIPTQKGRNYTSFAKGREKLDELLGGKLIFDSDKNQWRFKHNKMIFPISLTSEGTKKLSIFHQLLANRYLGKDSIIFIDELESGLHPKAISSFLDIVVDLSNIGLQFFIATHSYFVIKNLCLLAKKHKMPVPVISLYESAPPQYDNMLDGMPKNGIIDESVRLYEAEVECAFGGAEDD